MLNVLKNTGLKFLALSLILFIADQATKITVLNTMELYEDINILPIF